MGGSTLSVRRSRLTGRYRQFSRHLRFAVRLTPKGGRDALEDWAPNADGRPYLKARVAAPPEDGKANTALVALLAKTLGVAKSCIRIASGENARLKVIEVEGETDALAAKLDALGRRK